jgi:hypothetical protein
MVNSLKRQAILVRLFVFERYVLKLAEDAALYRVT